MSLLNVKVPILHYSTFKTMPEGVELYRVNSDGREVYLGKFRKIKVEDGDGYFFETAGREDELWAIGEGDLDHEIYYFIKPYECLVQQLKKIRKIPG